MTAAQIHIEYFDEGPDTPLHPLFHQIASENTPRAAYLELAPEADPPHLRMDWDQDAGIPMDVWTGRRFQWRVSPYLIAADANALMEAALPLAQRIVAGYASHWADQEDTYVGGLNSNAQHAAWAIEHLCEDWQPDTHSAVMDAAQFCAEIEDEIKLKLDAGLHDEIARDLASDARYEGVTLDGLEDYLQQLADEAADDV